MRWQLDKAQQDSGRTGKDSFDDTVRRNLAFARLQDLVAWGRKNSIWPFNFGLVLLLRGNGHQSDQPV